MTTSFKAFMTRGSNMTRETLMVLKRFMMMALGTLGTLGMGALFVGTASADIPAPESLADVAACIVANPLPPARGGGPPRGPGPSVTVVADPVADLFMVAKVKDAEGVVTAVDTCMPGMGAKIDINLAARITDAGSRFQALNPESDDYADDLAELRAEFSGPVMDAIFEESLVRRATVAARKEFEDARILFTDTGDREEGATSGSEQKLYNELDVGTEDGAPKSPMISTLSNVEITVTAASGPPDRRVPATIVVDLGEDTPEVTTEAISGFSSTTDIGEIITQKETAEGDLKKAQAALKAVADGDLLLTTATIDYVNDLVRFRTDEIQKLADLITAIEQVEENVDTVAEYQTAKSSLEGFRSTLTRAEAAQKAKNGAALQALNDPGQQLEQLVALAESDYNSLVERGVTGSALMDALDTQTAARAARDAYVRAAGDSDNPAGELLTALIAQDDTGQALLTAVSDTYGKTVENKTAIEDLIGDDGLVAANTAHLVDHEERITTNEADIETNKAGIATNKTGIATNKAEIVRVEERVDSNWDAIGANQMDIATNRSNINGLRKGLDVATAGVAAAMALAALPDVEGARSFGVGLGTFDGKTAVAVGFSYGTERFTFKVGAATASGETGGSAGIGWSF